MFSNKSKILRGVALFLLLLFITPIIPVRADQNKKIGMTFLDGGGNPITTALDLRISLWDAYDTRSEDIDINGDIDINATHYGDYQTTFTITPDGDGYFIPITYGYYKLELNTLPSFPDISPFNAYLQVEYKNQGDPNTNYQIYDFVDDPPFQNVTRQLIDENSTYYTFDAGPRTNWNIFTIDANNNATTEIKLEFGETLAEYLQWSKTNVRFELSDDLFIDGGLTVNDDIDLNLNELIEFRLENLTSPPTCDTNAEGRLYYNSNNNNAYVCSGTSWKQI